MFTDTIKTATLEKHQQVEKLLVGKMKIIRCMDDYVDLLKIFYSYFGGLEQKIDAFITTENLTDYNQRRKTDSIAGDIKILGGIVPGFAGNENLPVINNQSQAFGALYVMEGSTLGGKIIAAMLQKHLNFNNDEGLSFFNSYGDNAMQMWAIFKLVLNNVAKTGENETEVIFTANETFVKFKAWLEKSREIAF